MNDSGRFESLHCVALRAKGVLASTPTAGLHLQYDKASHLSTPIDKPKYPHVDAYPKLPGVGGALVRTVI